ncbi:MAG: contractile injection system tape measure protein [Proteobacteria bacterium]|nr:contractile injection system tape measure protein [Pseudomonadota bacterium]
MSNQRHMILKQTVEITVPSSDQAWPLQEQISQIMRTQIKPLIERTCDSLSAPDCLHRVDRLELDLGLVDANSLSKQLPALFDEAFKRALGKAFAQPAPSGLSAKVASQWELFTQFLREGTLPWWADLAKPHQVEDSIDYLLKEAPDLLRQSLPSLALDVRGLRRMIRQLEDRQLAALVALQTPALGELGLPLFHGLTQAREHIPQTAATLGPRLRAHVWQSILQNALLPEPAPANLTDFARGVLLRLARLQGVSYPVAVKGFALASGSLQNPASEIANLLMHELDAVRHDQASNNRGDDESGHKGIDESGRKPSIEHFRGFENPDNPAGLPEQGTGVSVHSPLPFPGNAAILAAISAGEPPALPRGSERLRTGQVGRVATGEPQGFNNAALLPLAKRDNDEEGIILDNAGLVILWPFMGELFERLGLAKEKTIVGENARQRGVALLQYLCTGDFSPSEYLLPLNKVLCGMDQMAVFEFDEPLSEPETDACDSLIASVIAQVPIFDGMGIDGFRGNFLIRAGILQLGHYGWLLRVERETYDVVLEHFPWQFDWVKLPWMEDPLQVEW